MYEHLNNRLNSGIYTQLDQFSFSNQTYNIVFIIYYEYLLLWYICIFSSIPQL